MRRGLCAERDRHPDHKHRSPTLGLFWCSGDPADREPWRSQRREDQRRSLPLTKRKEAP